jgi:hypothetical protein
MPAKAASVTARSGQHRRQLNSEAKTNKAQPDAGGDLVSALQAPRVIDQSETLLPPVKTVPSSTPIPTPFFEIWLRRSPYELDQTPTIPSARPIVLRHRAKTPSLRAAQREDVRRADAADEIRQPCITGRRLSSKPDRA